MHQLVDQRPVFVGQRRQGGDGGIFVQRAGLVVFQIVVVGIIRELRTAVPVPAGGTVRLVCRT